MGRLKGSRDKQPRRPRKQLTPRGRRTRRSILRLLAWMPEATLKDLLITCGLHCKSQGNMRLHLDQLVTDGHLVGELGAFEVTQKGYAWAQRDEFLDKVRPAHKDLEGQELLPFATAPAPPVKARPVLNL